MKIGKPTHMKLKNGATACGIVGATHSTYDARGVNCLRCQRTKAYKVYMGETK